MRFVLKSHKRPDHTEFEVENTWTTISITYLQLCREHVDDDLYYLLAIVSPTEVPRESAFMNQLSINGYSLHTKQEIPHTHTHTHTHVRAQTRLDNRNAEET